MSILNRGKARPKLATKDKGRAPGKDTTPKTSTAPNHTATDPLIGWFELAKPARACQQMRGWQRGGRK